MSDQEVLEQLIQRGFWYRPVYEGSKGFWKSALSGAFFAGPFVTAIPAMSWVRLKWPLWYLLIPLGVNAFCLILVASLFSLFVSQKFEKMTLTQRRANSCAWFFLMLCWFAFYSSLMVLLASGTVFLWIPSLTHWWWVPAVLYVVCGVGMWMGRMKIVRAIIEGPHAHPWIWPVRLLFTATLGICILTGVVARILIDLIGQVGGITLSYLVVSGMGLGLSLLFLGLSMMAGIIGYLHYQRRKGANELKI